jgi:hypothetical protein
VILQRRRGAEQGHHSVAREIDGATAVVAHDRRRPHHQFGHDLAEPLGIQYGRDVHRADHVGEQHRHLLVLGCAGRHGERDTALITELGVVPQHSAA